MNEERTFTIGGKAVILSTRAVENAVRNIEPGPIKKYSVVIRGARYPIKQVISLASKQPAAVFIATDAYRILRRLGFQVDSETLPQIVKPKLTVHELGRVSDSFTFGTGRIFQYRVGNMPPGYQALIMNFGVPDCDDWKIMRIEDHAQAEWSGHYESAEDALTALQKDFS